MQIWKIRSTAILPLKVMRSGYVPLIAHVCEAQSLNIARNET